MGKISVLGKLSLSERTFKTMLIRFNDMQKEKNTFNSHWCVIHLLICETSPLQPFLLYCIVSHRLCVLPFPWAISRKHGEGFSWHLEQKWWEFITAFFFSSFFYPYLQNERIRFPSWNNCDCRDTLHPCRVPECYFPPQFHQFSSQFNLKCRERNCKVVLVHECEYKEVSSTIKSPVKWTKDWTNRTNSSVVAAILMHPSLFHY